MSESQFIKNYKKRWSYRIIALAFCTLAIIAIIALGIFMYINNKNNPVIVKNLEDYKKALDDDSYIQISSDKLYDLNIDVVKTTSKLGIPIYKTVESKFAAIKLDPFILAINLSKSDFEKFMHQEKGAYVLKGTLVELKDNEVETLKHAIKSNASFSGGTQEPYLQYLKYETPINSVSVYFTVAALLFMYALFLYLLIMRKNTVALKSLKNYSNEDFEITCSKIDHELDLPDTYKKDPVAITKNYIVVQSQKIVFALPSKELMWVYKETIKKKAFFVIPVSTTNKLTFVFSDKNSYSIDFLKKEKVVDEIINHISKNSKTCFIGYTEELKKLYKKDYDEFMFRWKHLRKDYQM